jgi:fucose permease
MTNEDLLTRLRSLQAVNQLKMLGEQLPELNTEASTSFETKVVPPSAKLPCAALLSQCLQFFWMGFAWPSMGAVLPRIREMYNLNYTEGTLVFGVFACGLMLGCFFAFDEGREAVARFCVVVREKFRNIEGIKRHAEFRDEDETGAPKKTVDSLQQQQLRYSTLQRILKDSDKMKLLASVTITVISQLLMGTIVSRASYTFCLGIWFFMGMSNTGLNIFSGILVSRLAAAQTTAIFACQGPSYGIAAMLASPLAAAIMVQMDNDFSWFYLLQAALGFFVIAGIAYSDFPFDDGTTSATSSSSNITYNATTSHSSLLIKDRRFTLVMLSSFFYWGLDGVISQWITTVLLDQGHSYSFSSQVLSLLWGGVLVGRGIMAIVSVSIYKGNPLRNCILMLVCTPLALACALPIALSPPVSTMLLTLAFFYGVFLAPMDALLRGLTGALFKHPETGQTNTPFTLLFFACNGSLLVFTPLAGVVIQASGSGSAGLFLGIACGACVLCMVFCLWWKLK